MTIHTNESWIRGESRIRKITGWRLMARIRMRIRAARERYTIATIGDIPIQTNTTPKVVNRVNNNMVSPLPPKKANILLVNPKIPSL
jgi:hypothetical protein